MTAHHVVDGPADGPVLVLVGSLGSTVEMWRPQLPALAGRFRVVRVDLRGHGGSPARPGKYRVADLADDVRALLDDLGVDRVDWCGLSLGAMVGMYLAAEHPERIGRLVLCCTSAHFPDPTVWHDRIAAVSAGGTASIARAVVDRWFTPGWAAAHPDTVAEARAMVAGTSDEGYIGCCAALAALGPSRPAVARSPLRHWWSPVRTTPPRRSTRTPARLPPASRTPGWRSSPARTWRPSSRPTRSTALLVGHLARSTGRP